MQYDAVWFAGKGLAVVLIGLLTLLARSQLEYTRLRLVVFAVNIVILSVAAPCGAHP